MISSADSNIWVETAQWLRVEHKYVGGKISKSELSTCTAEEALYSLFQKVQPRQVLYVLCFRRVRPAKYGIHCVFEGAKQCSGFERKIRKSELSTKHDQYEVLFLRRPSEAKYCIYCVFEGSAEQKYSIYCF